MLGRKLIQGEEYRQQHEANVVKLRLELNTDASVWNAFRAGDDNALITIFGQESDALYNYGIRIYRDEQVVQDSIQDLFAELCQNRTGLGETNSIRFYLFKALRRKLFRFRKNTLRSLFFLNDDQEVPSTEFVMISDQIAEERKEQVSALMKSLSKRQREAVFLRFYEDLGYDKIAEIMNISRQGAYNMVSKAMIQLRGCL